MTRIKKISGVLAFVFVTGCSSYGVIDNTPTASSQTPESAYSLQFRKNRADSANDISLILAFSGGGTRAAAIAYGVLTELRDTKIVIDGQSRSLLEEVDVISSVSGGSFTSSYFGLYGDRIFEDFEEVFLRQDIESKLVHGLFNPARWFSTKGRTEMAVELYEKTIFHGATFADMKRAGGPFIIINASDLAYGVRFSFIQEYFNLLCSDLSSFPVSRAVTASSAVPIVFNPVVLENYRDCKSEKPAWIKAARERAGSNPELAELVAGLDTYYSNSDRQYAHYVDGGITDNLGLRAIYEILSVVGGPGEFLQKTHRKPPRHFVVISIDASTEPEPTMDSSNKQPGLSEAVGAISGVQLHRYNTATLELMDESMERWTSEISTPERPVAPYFIKMGFKDVAKPADRHFFNQIPTSFSLSGEQVDRLISVGPQLLRKNSDYQRLLTDLGVVR